jgi:formate hydrogenlyase subunit 3/multisubunit Na+/H+ antiporter MnhD subunit
VSVAEVLILAGAWERRVSVAPVVQAAGMALLGVGGAVVLFTGQTVGSSFHDAIDPAFGVDRLSGFLLATVAIVAAPRCSIAVANSRAHRELGRW